MFATLNHVATLDLSKDGRKELPLNWEPKNHIILSYYDCSHKEKKNITDICAMDI